MNLDATPETVRNLADAFELAALLDDRFAHPDKARMAAWAAQIERHRFIRADLLDGVQAFYDHPAERPIGVGDLIHHARIVKRDRVEREINAREVHYERLANSAALDAVHTMASRLTFGTPENPTERLELAKAALQVCVGKQQSQAAIQEFLEAKAAAKGKPRAKR